MSEDTMDKTNTNDSLDVLVVEDSRTQARYLRLILEEEGYRVTIAGDGKEAWREIEKTRPDVILTDIMMPEMDGYELCQAVKSNEATADIPVILVTQLSDPVDVIKGLEAGADNFIIKPFEEADIQSRMKDFLPKTREIVQEGDS